MEASAFQRPVAAQRRRLPRLQRSDAALAARVRGGDERAFEELYDRHAAPLLAFCRHLLGSREESEDALQHTFLSAHRALERDGAPDHVKAWLYTIARNRCLSVLRARRDEVALDGDGGWAGTISTRGLAVEVEERADLRALVGDLGRLPDEQRAALVLFELGDHSQDDIAEILGVRREKVKALVFQAREALIGWRAARETPCADVREQLSTLRGSALRRAPLRRHVELCAGCREFDEQVRRQRACLAVVLPVAPAAGLKSAVMSSALGGGTAAAATTAAAAGTGALGAAAVAKGVAAKALVAIAIAGGAGGAGYVAVEHSATQPTPAPAPAPTASKATPRATATRQASHAAPAGAAARAATPAATRSHGAQGAAKRHSHAHRPGAAKTPTRTRAHGTAGAPGHVKARAKPQPAAATKARRTGRHAHATRTKAPPAAKARRTPAARRVARTPAPVPKVTKPKATVPVVPETPAVTATPVVPDAVPAPAPNGNSGKSQP